MSNGEGKEVDNTLVDWDTNICSYGATHSFAIGIRVHASRRSHILLLGWMVDRERSNILLANGYFFHAIRGLCCDYLVVSQMHLIL